MELVALQKLNVHQVYKRSAVLELLLSLIHALIQVFQARISKLLLNRVHKGFENERERGFDRFKPFCVSDSSEACFKHQCNKVVPPLFTVNDTLGVVCCHHEDLLEFLLVVDV